MKRLSALALLALPTLFAAPAAAQKIAVTGGKTDETNVVVSARLPAGGATVANTVALPDGTHVPAQVTAGSMPGEKDVAQYLVFVLPKLKAGETVEVTPTMLNYVKAPPQFHFVEEKGKPTELLFDTRPVLQYFNLPHDPADHFYTFKPFHNVYDPATGKTMLTNSSAKTAKDGLYPHHRGLFFGFNKISYGDKQTADIWHGTDNVFSQHDKTLATEAGEVLGRQRVAISWHGKDGKTFATEDREVTAYTVPGGTLIDWNTVLSTKLDKVRLDGDPQHSGFHFRAAQEVAKNGKENTYYLRPDGKGKVGDTRNWDANPKAAVSKDPRTVNLPWNAMSFVIDGKRYTVLRINHPDNPRETRGSERDYGRFGDYFEYDLTPDKPLKLKYRVWVQEGEMTVEQCQALAAAFVSPPATKTK
jgi:Methane oxygenase PmoA